MSLVQKSAFQQILRLNENGVDVEFSSPDCQRNEDVLFTVLRFFVACMNARNTLKYGVFIAGVKGEVDQPPFGPVKLQLDPESTKSRITSLLNRCVFAKEGGKERPLDAGESKQMKLEVFYSLYTTFLCNLSQPVLGVHSYTEHGCLREQPLCF